MNKKESDTVELYPNVNKGQAWLLAFQHVFAMFGATVLVPLLTGLNPSVALISAGCGTLLFHLVTGGKVPVFLGSSFAFIGVIIAVGEKDVVNFGYVGCGLIAAGVVYLIFAGIVKLVGVDFIKKIFPPIVTGPVIMVIGLHLAPIAVGMASGKAIGAATHESWVLAGVAMLTIIGVSCFMKGFFKLVPIIIGIVASYVVAAVWGKVDYSAVTSVVENKEFFISLGDFSFPKFSATAIATIAPIAIVTFMEHIGDITTNSAVVGKDFLKKPGLHRTLCGDGVATIFAGLIGGPANTTYSENTGVLAVTKNYNPAIIRMAAVVAIVLGCLKPVGAVLKTVPVATMGGVCLILFGMIASIGMRTISEAKIDFTHSRNLIIVSLILVTGLGGVSIPLNGALALEGISLAALTGLVANFILHILIPDNPEND